MLYYNLKVSIKFYKFKANSKIFNILISQLFEFFKLYKFFKSLRIEFDIFFTLCAFFVIILYGLKI